MRRGRHQQGASMSIELARLELKRPDDLAAFEAALLGWGPAKLRRLALFFRVPGEYEDGSREKAHVGVSQVLQRHGLGAKSGNGDCGRLRRCRDPVRLCVCRSDR